MRFRKPDEKESALLAAIPVALLYLFLRSVMQEERAFLTSLSVYVFYAIISNIKRRKHDALFWIIIGSFAVLHIIALSLVKFPPFNGPSLAVAAPFMFIDGFAMWGILKWFEKHSFVDRRD